jgi:hypothetical protein
VSFWSSSLNLSEKNWMHCSMSLSFTGGTSSLDISDLNDILAFSSDC